MNDLGEDLKKIAADGFAAGLANSAFEELGLSRNPYNPESGEGQLWDASFAAGRTASRGVIPAEIIDRGLERVRA